MSNSGHRFWPDAIMGKAAIESVGGTHEAQGKMPAMRKSCRLSGFCWGSPLEQSKMGFLVLRLQGPRASP